MSPKTFFDGKRSMRELRKEESQPVRLEKKREFPSAEEDALIRERKKRERSSNKWLSGILAALTLGALVIYVYHPFFRVKQVEVSGVESLSREEVYYFSGVGDLPIFMVDEKAAAEKLTRRFQIVADADVHAELPNRVAIQFEERVPVVEWNFGGSKIWLDENGLVLNEVLPQDDVIKVSADSFPGALSRDDRNLPDSFSPNAMRMLMKIEKMVPPGKTLYFTYDHGYGWDTEDGYRIFYGKSDNDLEERERMAKELIEYLRKKEILPAMLSLEFKDAPYYRLKE